MTLRDTILDQVRLVAAQQNKTLAPLTDDLYLLESGLDSLCVALLVANLEDELGLDPFGSGNEVAIPLTIGDLIAVYEACAV
jgi:acyl carrier protein